MGDTDPERAIFSPRGRIPLQCLGSNGAGKLKAEFANAGGYLLVAVKKGYIPGYTGIMIVAPKTIRSARMVPYGAVLGEILANHKRRSLNSQPEDFVFCKPDGDSFNQDVLRKDVLYPILDRLNISRPKRSAGFHCFRHSAASLINSQTGNLKLAQNLLGHSNLSTTADVYTHTSTEAQREASEILEQAVFGNPFPICSQKGTGTVQ